MFVSGSDGIVITGTDPTASSTTTADKDCAILFANAGFSAAFIVLVLMLYTLC